MNMSIERAGAIIITLTVVMMFGVVLLTMLYIAVMYPEAVGKMPPEWFGLITTMTGFLGAAFAGAVGYWISTTASSKRKDETIAGMVGTGNGASPVTANQPEVVNVNTGGG